jgi:hypothetical protein
MKRLALLTTAVLMVACGDAPTAPADSPAPSFAAVTFTESISFPVDIAVFIECADGGAGEGVIVSGNLHSMFHSTSNANRFTTVIHNQPQGVSGTGLTTGDKYQGTGATLETITGSLVNGQFSNTFVNNFRMIGQGPDNNFTVHQTFHVTFNANGELTASVDNFTADCT